MTTEEFDRRNKADWAAAIHRAFGDTPPRSAKWTGRENIVAVLRPFMAPNLNHTMLPVGGGLDMDAASLSTEDDCLDFHPGERLRDRCRPSMLSFEYFPESEWNSFFLLECQQLAASGVYEDIERNYEELVEVEPGHFIDRSHHDTGVLTHDENGDEVPLPRTSLLVSRYLSGKFLIVAKRSIWNRVHSTYDGRHNGMTSEQIRAQIQEAIDHSRSQQEA